MPETKPGSVEAFGGFADDEVDLDSTMAMATAMGGGEKETVSGVEQYRTKVGDWTEKGVITLEDWTEDQPYWDTWSEGPEPAWFKTGQRKVVTDADYSKSTIPDGVSFAYVKLVNANFRVR